MTRAVNLLFVAAVTLLLVVLFHWLGNTSDIHLAGTSVLMWMVTRWQDVGGQYSHSALIPLVTLWLLWRRRGALSAAPRTVDNRGLWIVVGSLLLHLLGARLEQPRLSLLALAGLLWGIPMYLAGPAVARLLLFPCAYLLFCIPMTFLDALSVPLRLLGSLMATAFLNGIGIATLRSGTAILSARPGGFRLEVADPCSGLGYLLALLALAALYAHLTQPTLRRQWILFAMAVPIAVIANIVRIIVIALFSAWGGAGFASVLYHYGSGYLVFLTALLLLFGTGRLLAVNYRDRWEQWKREHKPHA